MERRLIEMVSKSQSVLTAIATKSSSVSVSFNNFSTHDREKGVISSKAVIITRELWIEMGSPETVTITLEPGDHLQEPPTHEEARNTLGLEDQEDQDAGN